MKLSLSDETERLRAKLRDWAVNEGRSVARSSDRSHMLTTETERLLATYPIDLNPLAGDLAPAGDKEYVAGLPDGSHVLGVAAIEEISYGDMTLVMLLRGSGIGGVVVKVLGSPEQVDKWFGGFARGDYQYGSFALTEPDTGSDAGALSTSAVRDGDHWILNGTKIFCSGGSMSDYIVVFARDKDTSTGGTTGIRAFVVEKGTPGLKIVKPNEDKLGVRALVTTELVLDDAMVPAENCLARGGLENGFQAALTTLSQTRPQAAALALGIGQASLDTAGEYLRSQRASFSVPRWRRVESELERMDAALHQARLMVRNAAWLTDQGLPHAKEASMAKAYACPIAEKVAARALLLMGSEGSSERHLIEKWYRDLKVFDIWEGTGNIQRIVISRQLFGK